MEIKGKITGIKYKPLLAEAQAAMSVSLYDINKAPSVCLLSGKKSTFAVSKWVSPKRTRSYPYERVYNMLDIPKRITVIPIIKDEGSGGDRDFLQWDTVSLMSLLDVYVILAYYHKAVKSPDYDNKITDFQFKNKYVLSKIKEIGRYQSSALHWNLNEMTNNLQNIIDKAKQCFEKIELKTGVKLYHVRGINNFQSRISKDIEQFMQFPCEKAEEAPAQEIVAAQPQESLSPHTDVKITITDYLGGQYFFTVDEVEVKNDTVYLIESKHSKSSILPGVGDIKEGLLKMMLYSNLGEVEVDGVPMKSRAVLRLTSPKIDGEIDSKVEIWDRPAFLLYNNFSQAQMHFVDALLDEAVENGFDVKIRRENND
jgi:hypothetical protein